MTTTGTRPGWDGHLLLLYNAESQRRTGVAAWVRRGLELGAKILYTQAPDESPVRAMPRMVTDQPEVLDAMERGQIEVFEANHTTYDPAWQACVVKRAIQQGYPSVLWSAEATTAWRVMSRDQHAEIERATDRLCESLPVSVMCQYAASESLGALSLIGSAHGAGIREGPFQALPLEVGLAVAGELDISNVAILRALLAAGTEAAEREPFLVDLEDLTFLDVGAARTLGSGTFAHRCSGGRVVLRHPQPIVERVLRLLGVDMTSGMRLEVAP